MDDVSQEVQLESLESIQSTILKLQNALSRMNEKGANTTLVQKRLEAMDISLALLENVWQQEPHQYSREDLRQARNILAGLRPSIENSYEKSKAGSPQKTLLKRRIKALDLTLQAIDDLTTE